MNHTENDINMRNSNFDLIAWISENITYMSTKQLVKALKLCKSEQMHNLEVYRTLWIDKYHINKNSPKF